MARPAACSGTSRRQWDSPGSVASWQGFPVFASAEHHSPVLVDRASGDAGSVTRNFARHLGIRGGASHGGLHPRGRTAQVRAAGFRIVSSGRRGGELLGDANRCAKLAVARSRSSDGSDQACCARGAAQRDQALARRAEIAQAVSVTGVETSGRAGPAAANETLVSLLDKSPPVVRDALLRPPKRESDSPAGQEECSICYIFLWRLLQFSLPGRFDPTYS